MPEYAFSGLPELLRPTPHLNEDIVLEGVTILVLNISHNSLIPSCSISLLVVRGVFAFKNSPVILLIKEKQDAYCPQM